VKKILEAKDICKSFSGPAETTVLSGISLTVFAGESVAITGKSGEGKSTLLHILGTLEEPTSGEIVFGEIKPTAQNISWIRSRYVGFIFQAFNLLDDYTVLENVLMPAKIARTETRKGSLAYNRALELLEEVGLEKRSDFPAKLLSGGEKQRAAIARALCNDPELILADEPSGNLDHRHSAAVHELLIAGAKKRGKALVIVTHDKELAALCGRTHNLMDGRLL